MSNTAYLWPSALVQNQARAADGLNRDAAIASVAGGYDARGNLTFDGTRRVTYDEENRLLTESGPATAALSYDPLGRLSGAVINGAVTNFLYSGSKLVAEYDGSGNVLRRYFHGVGVDSPDIWIEGAAVTAANANFLIKDRQGSVIGAVNTAGTETAVYRYGPYGEPDAWGGSRFRYTGQIELPELQLYHYKARVYDPTMARFLQTDPIGYRDGPDWYLYVHDDPLNHVDPMGACTGSRIENKDGTCAATGAGSTSGYTASNTDTSKRGNQTSFASAAADTIQAASDASSGAHINPPKGLGPISTLASSALDISDGVTDISHGAPIDEAIVTGISKFALGSLGGIAGGTLGGIAGGSVPAGNLTGVPEIVGAVSGGNFGANTGEKAGAQIGNFYAAQKKIAVENMMNIRANATLAYGRFVNSLIDPLH